ncbi:hypothetical protein ACFQRB_20505 [Halobaculum litoreum]|uniref:Uncharacterized protein n=1 Tax=Halobaculum litoreum TaxID=3031998 RepID=A0ABD5XXG5_9EURY
METKLLEELRDGLVVLEVPLDPLGEVVADLDGSGHRVDTGGFGT